MRALARQLVAAGPGGPGLGAADPEAVLEKLRVSLTRLAGIDGFASLQRRALALARAADPSLRGVSVDELGRLHGLDRLRAGDGEQASRDPLQAPRPDPSADLRREATIAVVAQLLDLLVTFIGEPITLRLVREAWPDAILNDRHPADAHQEHNEHEEEEEEDR